MEEIVEIAALAITGPMVGVEIGVAAFTNPIVDRLPDDAYRQFRSHGSRLLGVVMAAWYTTSLVLLTAAAVVTWRDWLVTAAAVLMALVVLLTVTVLVPTNNRIGAWSQTADVDRDLARRWDRLHWLRVAILVVLFVAPSVSADRIMPWRLWPISKPALRHWKPTALIIVRCWPPLERWGKKSMA